MYSRDRLLEDVLAKLSENPITILIAPTGFGKTHLAKIMVERGVRSLHLLPLKALVSDVMGKLHGRACYQAGVSIEGAVKDPYMLCHHMVATYDSTLLASLIAPVADMAKQRAHWDVASLSMYGRVMLMDEIHLLAKTEEVGDIEGGLASSKLFYIISVLASLLVKYYDSKVIYATASIAAEYINILYNAFRGSTSRPRVVIVGGDVIGKYYSSHLNIASGVEFIPIDAIKDYDFAYIKGFYKDNVLTIIDKGDTVDIALKVIKDNSHERVLIVTNTVGRAVEVYKKLKESCDSHKILLLHGRLGVQDKEGRFREFEELYKNRRPLILVSTQVVEAGLDRSFDVVISDIAPVESLVQRFGRILRNKGDVEYAESRGVKPLLIVSLSDKARKGCEVIYGASITKIVEEGLRNLKAKADPIIHDGFNLYRIDWRYGEGLTGYSLLENYTININLGDFEVILNNIEGLLRSLPILYNNLPDRLREVSMFIGSEGLRGSMLVPLVVCEDGECAHYDIVEVSTSFLKYRYKDLLCPSSGMCEITSLLKLYDTEKISTDIQVKKVSKRKFHDILENPLVCFHEFVNSVKQEYGGRVIVYFLGFKVVRGYDREYGIV